MIAMVFLGLSQGHPQLAGIGGLPKRCLVAGNGPVEEAEAAEGFAYPQHDMSIARSQYLQLLPQGQGIGG